MQRIEQISCTNSSFLPINNETTLLYLPRRLSFIPLYLVSVLTFGFQAKTKMIIMKLSIILAFLPAILAAPTSTPDDPDALVNKYVVKFKEGIVSIDDDDVIRSIKTKADFLYENVFTGFAGHLTAEEHAALLARPDVSSSFPLAIP